LGAILLVFAAMIFLARTVPGNTTLTNFLIAISFLSSSAVIYMLVLYQVWQNTEREKLRDIAGHFSSFSQFTRAIKSSREANVHRYTLLFFMIGAILLANVVLVMAVSPLYR
jgi:hypothetical protein